MFLARAGRSDLGKGGVLYAVIYPSIIPSLPYLKSKVPSNWANGRVDQNCSKNHKTSFSTHLPRSRPESLLLLPLVLRFLRFFRFPRCHRRQRAAGAVRRLLRPRRGSTAPEAARAVEVPRGAEPGSHGTEAPGEEQQGNLKNDGPKVGKWAFLWLPCGQINKRKNKYIYIYIYIKLYIYK